MSDRLNLENPTREQNLDFSLLAQEILVLLRGELSQVELSQKLGFSFNQCGKWESGVTIIHWQDFVRVCEALDIPWQRHFNDVFAFHQGMTIENNPVFECLSRFFGYSSLMEMAQTLHKSRSSISRLLNNQVKIHFSDILQLMDIRPFVLGSWLAKFLQPSRLESFKVKYQSELAMYKAVVSYPEAALVNFCFHLDSYWALPAHSDAWIAERVGLKEQQIPQAIEHLLKSGLIHKVGDKYRSMEKELTSLRLPEFRKVIQYMNNWTTETYNGSRSFTPNFENPSISALRLYPVSSKAGKEIVDALVVFHHQVAEIVKKDQGPKDHVRAILLHCLDMGISQGLSSSDTSKP